MGTQFMHDALPPVLSVEEASCSVIGNGMRMEENGRLRNRVEVTPDTMVRLVRGNCSRFVREEVKLEDGTTETQYRLYLSIDNSKEYHQEEPQYLILPESMVTAMKFLITSYPSFTPINMLPCETEDDKMLLASDLWDRGILVTETPFDEMNQDETLQSIYDVSADENEESQEGHDENCDVSDIKNILREMVADEELNKEQDDQTEKPTKKNKNKKEKRLESQTEKTLDVSNDEVASNKSDDDLQYFLCSEEESNCES